MHVSIRALSPIGTFVSDICICDSINEYYYYYNIFLDLDFTSVDM